MVQIIYLDIDGTLRDEQMGIPESAVRAVHRCREKGIRIIICTGRNTGSIQEDVWELPIDGVISGGGCCIRYQGKTLVERHFPEELAGEIITMASHRKLSLAVETEQKIYMDHNACEFYKKDFQHKISRSSCKHVGVENSTGYGMVIQQQNRIDYRDNFNELENSSPPIHKICMFGEMDSIDRTERELQQAAEVIQKREWNGQWYLELLPKGCDKGSTVSWLNHRLGIPKCRSMSFGDSENDIAMMRATGIAVAVGNSSPMVQKYASSVCKTVLEDGIYRELVKRNIITDIREGKEPGYEQTVVAGGSGLSDLSEKLLRQQ